MSGLLPSPADRIRAAACLAIGLLLALAAPAFAQNVVCSPDPLEISLADAGGSDSIHVTYTGGGSGAVFGYSIKLAWDTSVVSASFTKPDTGPFSTTDWFVAQVESPGLVRIDAALPGGTQNGITSGDLFKVTFTAAGTPDYDSSVLTLSLVSLRDESNNSLSGFTPGNGLVEVDLVAPVVTDVAITNTTLSHTNEFLKNGDAITVTATVSDGDPTFGTGNFSADLSGFGGSANAVATSYAAGLATWTVAAATCTPADGIITVEVSAADPLGNAADASDTITADNTAPTAVAGLAASPGHKKVNLTWTDASAQDANYAGVIIRYVAWGAYADYGSTLPSPVSAPSYPNGPAAGDGTAFDGTGALATHTFTTDDRDIYYYSAFVYDQALNYSSPAASAQDRSTNYWLGDVGAGAGVGPYDGLVGVGDVTALGSTYGLLESSGHANWKSECDVGPTDDSSRLGIPVPDDAVQFEDLMIFAMNAGVVTPTKQMLPGTPEPILAWARDEDGAWSLHLVEPCANFKGLNVSGPLAAGSVTVSAGALLAEQSAPVFLQNIDRLGLDAGLALLGNNQGFEGSGELMRVVLPEGADPENLRIHARGIDNEPYEVESQVSTDASTPRPFGLGQNVPNPFNPSTKIAFSLPDAQTVELSVYTLDGRLVRTLLHEPRAAGVHVVTWNGRDDDGRRASSGAYVYRLMAGPYGETRKMILMK